VVYIAVCSYDWQCPTSFPSTLVFTRDEVEEVLLRILFLPFSFYIVNKHQVFAMPPPFFSARNVLIKVK